MRIMLIGINHCTAGVSLRERFAMQGHRLRQSIQRFVDQYPGVELVILSTCHRTEWYLARPAHDEPSAEEVIGFFAGLCDAQDGSLRAASIHRENEQAVGHLFRVSCGLESMVLGETQILGQVKRAYETAHEVGSVGPVLHRVFQRAIRVGKQVRTATGINAGRRSIGSVAVDFARQIFERFDNKTVVGIGAGAMGKVTLRHLCGLRPAKLWLANRTPGRAEALAQQLGLSDGRGGARSFEDLPQLLVEADIVVTCTGADRPIITEQQFRGLLRRRRQRPIFLVDIALPRDVDPEVGRLKNVYLYNIDDLQNVIKQTDDQRSHHTQQCETLLLDAVRRCLREVRHQDVGQLIRALKHKLHALSQAEHQRTLRKLSHSDNGVDADQLAEALKQHDHRLINKILHLPLSQLHHRQDDSPLGFYAAALRRLFDLEDTPAADEPDAAHPTPPQTCDPVPPQPLGPASAPRARHTEPISPVRA